MALNTRQQQAVDTVLEHRESLFLTGPGGTGKSYVVRHQLESLESHEDFRGKVYVTATTGMAASNLNIKTATTIHSFAGIPFNIVGATPEQRVNVAMKNGRAMKRIRAAKLLIIDEISMLSTANFEFLNMLFQRARRNQLIFGGCLVVACGDFLQLSPIPDNNKGDDDGDKPCFQSALWSQVFRGSRNMILLEEIYRQSDPDFIRCLHKIRLGQGADREVLELMRELQRPLPVRNDIKPTILVATNASAKDINDSELNSLPDDEHTFRSKDNVAPAHMLANKTKSQILDTAFPLVPENLKLKIGAQVICLKNMSNGQITNGTRAVVVDIVRAQKNIDAFDRDLIRIKTLDGRIHKITEQTWEIMDNSGELVMSRTQLPLQLAWAITIHKSQGQSIDYMIADLNKAFSPGQVYVALSRATSKEALQVKNYRSSNVKANAKCIEFYQELERQNADCFEHKEKKRRID